MLVVSRNSAWDMESPLSPQQPMQRAPESGHERGGKGDGLECRKMPTHADIGTVIH